uniref:Protein preY, mitochondrial n=1 Tax=Ornithodoros turicata TaxID=34597 RepID=A0A2R5LFX1_9ACAR
MTSAAKRLATQNWMIRSMLAQRKEYVVPRSYCMRASESPKDRAQPTHVFDEQKLSVLVCPISKKPLRYDRDRNVLVCDEMKVAYPIVDGIPDLLPQSGKPLKAN